MAKFRKKPVVIEAVQWTGNNKSEIIAFCGVVTFYMHNPVITTKEGEMTAREGDWIIKGIAGEFYPCKPEIFKATYDPLEQAP